LPINPVLEHSLFPYEKAEPPRWLFLIAIWGKAQPKAQPAGFWREARYEAKRWFLVQALNEKEALRLVDRWIKRLALTLSMRTVKVRAKSRILDLGRNNV
jgi:hypothetical protein